VKIPASDEYAETWTRIRIKNLRDPKKTHEKIAKKCLRVIRRNYFFFGAAFLTGFFASGFFAAAFFAAAMCFPPPTGKGYIFS
jgi:hypothetical protein